MAEPCKHAWTEVHFHVCPSIATDANRHAHYRWSVCRKCGAGSVRRGR